MNGRAQSRAPGSSRPLRPVDSAQARRRTWYALVFVFLVWCLVVLPMALQVRSHHYAPSVLTAAAPVGYLLGMLVDPLWFGLAWRPSLTSKGGRVRVTARTLSGTRTLDLDELVRVGRATLPGRSPMDLLLLRDRHGIRLAIWDADVDDAIARAVRLRVEHSSRTPAKVSEYAADRLTAPFEPPRRSARRTFAGLVRLIGVLALCAVVSYGLARFIAG